MPRLHVIMLKKKQPRTLQMNLPDWCGASTYAVTTPAFWVSASDGQCVHLVW